MSYLSLPRIHFAGAFFANPSNLNNSISNYLNAQQNEPLTYETGTYNNPTGVGQFFFRDCVVTQCFDASGQSNEQDEFIGAKVETVNTWQEQLDENGKNFILAKIADLDPDMQFRTELYGIRIFIKNAQGSGLEGYMGIPQLRDLFFGRGAGGDQGMQVACGTWHQRFYVTKWELAEGDNNSTLALLKNITHNNQLDIKLSTDMFQCDPQQQYTVGNRYCYARMMATIGPVSEDMPLQVVPGRRLYSPISFAQLDSGTSNTLKKPIVTREAAEQQLSHSSVNQVSTTDTGLKNSNTWWNNTDARVVTNQSGQSFLLIDMGTSTTLKTPSNGLFDLGQKFEVGYLDEQDKFVPFAQQGYVQNGSLKSVIKQLQDFVELPEAAQYRDSAFFKNAGVVQIQLSKDEAEKIKNHRLNLELDGASVLRENKNGYYINFDTASLRMSPCQTDTLTTTGFQYGQPMGAINTPESILLNVGVEKMVYNNEQDSDSASYDSLNIDINSTQEPNKPGQFLMTVTAENSAPFDSKPTGSEYNNWLRQPLDSLICYVNVTSTCQLIGENPLIPNVPFYPAVSVLFWQDQFVTSEIPSWEENIQPILGIYSQLYPGMTSRMDIGNQETVVANASAFKARFSMEVEDPAFMPVVRDMSPDTINMMNRWLDIQIAESKKQEQTA